MNPPKPQNTWSRRRFVQVTASGVVSGCGPTTCGAQGSDASTFEVREVGQKLARVHRIRKPYPRSDLPEIRKRCKVAIVGAGAAGLSVAWALQKRGIEDFVLLELEPEIGGTARGGGNDHSRYPLGAHYLPAPSTAFPELQELLRDISWTTGKDKRGHLQYRPNLVCAFPQERHLYRGFWYDGLYPASGQTIHESDQIKAFVDHLHDLDAKTDASGRPLFRIPGRRSHSSLHPLDQLSAQEYLQQKGWDSWRLHWLVDYACRDDYGLRARECSAFAALHHFLGRGYKSYQDSVLLTAPEGNARLLYDIADFLRIQNRVEFNPAHRLWLGAMVRGLDATQGLLNIEVQGPRTQDGVPRSASTPQTPDHGPGPNQSQARFHAQIHADLIFWAAPRFVLSNLLARSSLNLSDQESLNPEMTPWLVASAHLEHLPAGPGVPLAWDNVAIEGDHLGYVVADHGRSRKSPSTHGTITLYQPILCKNAELRESRAWLASRTLEELTGRCISQLEGMHPKIHPQIRRLDISRWGHAMVRPTLGSLFSRRHAATDPRRAIARVIPCGTDTAGIPIFEEAFYGALEAVERSFGA